MDVDGDNDSIGVNDDDHDDDDDDDNVAEDNADVDIYGVMVYDGINTDSIRIVDTLSNFALFEFVVMSRLLIETAGDGMANDVGRTVDVVIDESIIQ